MELIPQFPLTYLDLMLWLAFNAVLLLTASELLRSLPGKKLMIDKKRLTMAALASGFAFVIAVSVHAYNTWMTLQP